MFVTEKKRAVYDETGAIYKYTIHDIESTSYDQFEEKMPPNR
jgi:hypothetical protein